MPRKYWNLSKLKFCLKWTKILPKILESNGKAEVSSKIKALFAINCVKLVFRLEGLTLAIKGIVYSPTADVTPKYMIMQTSNAAPKGPRTERDDIPRVNC